MGSCRYRLDDFQNTDTLLLVALNFFGDHTMTQELIIRTLWCETENKRITLNQNELLGCKESLVILGEAGMGKSTLLEWISTNPNYKLCTANQLINRHDPRTIIGDAKVLVIDALDERMAKKDGDALDQVLRKLGEISYPVSYSLVEWQIGEMRQLRPL